jgi:hypothetical protein
MERKDITTLISHFIPNEQLYHFEFPERILHKYSGRDNLDNTIDELLYLILHPLLENEIEYNYKLEWNTEHSNAWFHFINIRLTVNATKFEPELIIKNLQDQKMDEGLLLKKESSFGQLETIFSSE